MRICFVALHPYWGGLANGGGTRTILKSAEVLRDMGHRVDIAACADRFTWFAHPPIITKIPKDSDVVVAVSASEVNLVLKQAPASARPVWWMRGWETWQRPKEKILAKAAKIQTFTNSTWLRDKLRRHMIGAELCYAGLDLDGWHAGGTRSADAFCVGALYHKFHKTKRFDLYERVCDRIDERVGKKIKRVVLNRKPFCNLDIPGLQDMYSQCDIWFAPTTLEGFHNVPAEASLCGALVVCADCSSNGMGDYATTETAMLFDSEQDAIDRLMNPDYEKVKKMQHVLLEKIGSRQRNMNRFVELLQT